MAEFLEKYIGQDRYFLQKIIGEGKFSTVFQAKYISNDQDILYYLKNDSNHCSIKKLKFYSSMNEKERLKCRREIDIMKQLNHFNVLRLLDYFEQGDELFIVTQLMIKGDLKKMIRSLQIKNKFLSEIHLLEYMRQLTQGLMYLNEKKIIHRDLKPANIFISKSGNLKIGDLGLGREISETTDNCFTRVGTPLYMAPEIIKGEGYMYSCDVWSLGCVAYELVELTSPFRKIGQKLALNDLFTKITKAIINPFTNENISTQTKELILHMLKVEPLERISLSDIDKYCQIKIKSLIPIKTVDQSLYIEDIWHKLNLLNSFNFSLFDLHSIFLQSMQEFNNQNNLLKLLLKELEISQEITSINELTDLINQGNIDLEGNFQLPITKDDIKENLVKLINYFLSKILQQKKFTFLNPSFPQDQKIPINSTLCDDEQSSIFEEEIEESIEEENCQNSKLIDENQEYITTYIPDNQILCWDQEVLRHKEDFKDFQKCYYVED